MEAVAERDAGVVHGRLAADHFIAASHFELGAEVDDVAVAVDAAVRIQHGDEDLVCGCALEHRRARGAFGQRKCVVESAEAGEQRPDHDHDEREVAHDGAVLAPEVAVGEQVLRAIDFADAFDRVVALAKDGFDRRDATLVGEVRAMVGDVEIAVRDDALGAMHAAGDGPQAAHGAHGDCGENHGPEPGEPPRVEDIEQPEAVHGVGQAAIFRALQFEPGRTRREIRTHRRRELGEDRADEPGDNRRTDEQERELDVREQAPHAAHGVEAVHPAAEDSLRGRDGRRHGCIASIASRSCSSVTPCPNMRSITPSASIRIVTGSPGRR